MTENRIGSIQTRILTNTTVNKPSSVATATVLFLICFHRSPAVQLHLCPDRRYAVWGVVAGWLVLLGAADAAASHRMHGSGARRPYPPLQSEASQTGRPVVEWAHRRKEGPMICSGNKFVLCFDALRVATLHTNFVHTHVKRLPFIWSAFLYWSRLEMESF